MQSHTGRLTVQREQCLLLPTQCAQSIGDDPSVPESQCIASLPPSIRHARIDHKRLHKWAPSVPRTIRVGRFPNQMVEKSRMGRAPTVLVGLRMNVFSNTLLSTHALAAQICPSERCDWAANLQRNSSRDIQSVHGNDSTWDQDPVLMRPSWKELLHFVHEKLSLMRWRTGID